jgi:biopolymer transport protein ExbB
VGSILYLFKAGGVVMWPLLGFSLLGLTLIIERSFFWASLLSRQDALVREILQIYRQNPALAAKRLDENSDLPVARIFLAALSLDRPDRDDFRLALETAAQAEIPQLRRFNTAFDTVVSLAPLLGLLGTVLGLINSFGSLSPGNAGASNAGNVTGGISEALVSTATGLVVAIGVLLFSNTFRGLYRRQIALIQEYGGQLELIYRRYYSEQSSGNSEGYSRSEGDSNATH